MISDLEKRVVERIEQLEPELVKVALELGDMDTRDPIEKIAADYVHDWLKSNGFEVKKLGPPERFNVLGTYEGTGKGRSLLFCSHLDAGGRVEEAQYTVWNWDPISLRAWQEGDTLLGGGIGNCKGPMACWMIAAKAIKDLGIKLPGDILLSAVVGELNGSPVDEFPSPGFEADEVGARYVATHGGLADFALIAEATAFTICPVECGYAHFKVTIYTERSQYAWRFPYPEPSMEKSLSPIFRTVKFLERYRQYAYEYQQKHTYSFDGTEVVPKTIVGAIRGGAPFRPMVSPNFCSLYIYFSTPAGKDPLELKRDLEGILDELGMEGKVEMYKYLPGSEAWKVKNYETFKSALVDTHMKLFNKPLKKALPETSNMWRDINPYNELGVPAVSYGFPRAGMRPDEPAGGVGVKIKDMVDAAKVYALLALDICNRPL